MNHTKPQRIRSTPALQVAYLRGATFPPHSAKPFRGGISHSGGMKLMWKYYDFILLWRRSPLLFLLYLHKVNILHISHHCHVFLPCTRAVGTENPVTMWNLHKRMMIMHSNSPISLSVFLSSLLSPSPLSHLHFAADATWGNVRAPPPFRFLSAPRL